MTAEIIEQVYSPTPKQDTEQPEEIDLRDHVDLTAKLYPAYILVDDQGRPVENLRGAYETGDNDGEAPISAIDIEGYRNFKKKVVWQSWSELNNYEEPGTYKKPGFIGSPAVQKTSPKNIEKGGHTTIYGHEFVPHTGVNALLTQNPVINGFTENTVGDTQGHYGEPTKRISPLYHPISTAPHYEYWDEKQYFSITPNKNSDKKVSPDVYAMAWQLPVKCEHKEPHIGRIKGDVCEWTNLVYINPHNNQVYLYCPLCAKHHKDKIEAWHQVRDIETIQAIEYILGFKILKYRKEETEQEILDLAAENPGICYSDIAKTLDMTMGKVRRGVDRLKADKKVRTRHVGRSICVYAI